jgi:hypothetical protein
MSTVEIVKGHVMLFFVKAFLRVFGRWIYFPVHDSWSIPKTDAERHLVQMRLAQLERLEQLEPELPKPGMVH